MAFEVVKTFIVNAPQDAVWAFLTDPHKVARCLPGAAITDQVDDRTYNGTMTVKVGPVTTSYKGKVVFERLDTATHVAEVVATAKDIKGKGGADMKLSSSLKELGPGETEVTAVSKVNITGLLAQMGRGMIQDVSDELFQLFSERVRTELSTPEVPVGAAPEPQPLVDGPAIDPNPAPIVSVPRVEPDRPDRPAELDLNAIGARAARRATRRVLANPMFWVVLAAVAGIAYLVIR